MIVLKTTRELSLMKEACVISAGALKAAGAAVEPGVSTEEINRVAHDFIVRHGAVPTFLGYSGYPAASCISINDEVIHGIPSKKRIVKAGDIVSIDVGATFNGYVGDNAATFAAGEISPRHSGCATPPERAFTRVSRRLSRAAGSAISAQQSKGIARREASRWFGNTRATESAM